jgi:formylmethanofuran dehydrogenase subunit C
MPLVLECRSDSTLPIEVDGITVERLTGVAEREIATRPIWHGNQQIELGQLFRVQGEIDGSASIIWQGRLESVHWIGAYMKRGSMVLESSAGRHVGSQMSGGTIVAQANVSDFAGCEMTGGTLTIRGDAGHMLGGQLPGSRCGMNRGKIIVDGSAGNGTGQLMRRGTIAVGGDAGRLCGWNMLAGSIVVMGKCGEDFGAGMTRGTIVLAGRPAQPPPPTFARGGIYRHGAIPLLAKWLDEQGFHPARKLSSRSFQMFHGDILNGGRGEILLGI